MQKDRKTTPWYRQNAAGQALVEYILIVVLVIGALILALIMTGDAIGNIFSSTIFAAIGNDGVVRQTDAANPGATSFWLTVTWVASQTPEDKPFLTNVPKSTATSTPEGWVQPPAPTAIPTIPPEASPTVEPSSTPPDVAYIVPFDDRAANLVQEEKDTYRLASDIYVGQNAWQALYWRDNTLTGEPMNPLSNPTGPAYITSYDPNQQIFVDETTDLPRMDEQNFSAQYARIIWNETDNAIRLGFRLSNPSGGVRMYYHDEGTCANYKPSSNARNTATSDGSQCMILDQWVNSPPASPPIVYKDFPAGGGASSPSKFTLFIEYYHTTGQPYLDVDVIASQVNPDDAGLNAAAVSCNWGQFEGDRTNTRTYSWNSALGLDDFPDNQRCYLELRGYIKLDQLTKAPMLNFWHIWDLNGNTNVWLEVAKYDDSADPKLRPTSWTKVWPTGNLANTRNYEWTQEIIDLSTSALTFSASDALTYRFVIENNGGGSGRKRWYVDDVFAGDKYAIDLTDTNPLASETFTICEDRDTCDSFWTLDDDSQKTDFRTTGRWNLTSNRALSGKAWEDDPNNPYSLEPGNEADGDKRVYWIEFNKRIDVSNTSNNGVAFTNLPADADGDIGPPMLTFYTSYTLKDNAKLEVQYYDDATNAWQLLRTITRTDAGQERSRTDIHLIEIPLHEREQVDTNGNGTAVFDGNDEGWTEWYQKPLRIRFAMTIDDDAIAASSGIGWTIDNILIERLGTLSYTPYPFEDSAGDLEGDTMDVWFRTGTWGVTSSRAYGNKQKYSFTDSPNGNYIAGSTSVLELRSPFDLNADTPENPAATNCDATLPQVDNCNSTPQDAANKPILTFWWNRALQNGHRFTVDICPSGGKCGTPITVWEYNYNADDALQREWERVEIALYPFIENDAVSNVEDDIVVSFRLDASADSSVSADGILIDVIEIKDEEEKPTFKLWSGFNDGNGQSYIDTIEDRTPIPGDTSDTSDIDGRWWNRWYLGGGWAGLNTTSQFRAKSGTLVMHESLPISPDPFSASNSFRYAANSFHVLEMQRTIDLTGLKLANSGNDPIGMQIGGTDSTPIMYWWHRFDKGTKARMRVDIAEKITNPPATLSNPLTYGDDELYGWSEWKTVYITDSTSYSTNLQRYQWQRNAINLQNATVYDEDATNIGSANFVDKVIRVRFILDANDVVNSSDARDGWFFDDVEFSVRPPRIYDLPFVDRSQNMANWIGEGTWGLDVSKFTSSDPPAISTGDSVWTAEYLNCNYRPFLSPAGPAVADRGGCGLVTYDEMLMPEGDNYRPAMVNSSSPDYNTYNPNDQWYITNNISNFTLDINFNTDHSGRPPDAPQGYLWEDSFVAEYQRTISVEDPFRYTFYVRADDGVRVGISPYPTSTELNTFSEVAGQRNNPPAFNSYFDPNINQTVFYNNIINQWRYQSPTVYQSSVTLVPNTNGSSRDYLITVQYFEHVGTGELAFGVSGQYASFSDSPLQVPSVHEDQDRLPANYLSNTSLILDGLLDLRTARVPIIEYVAQWRTRNIDATVYFEVSSDGGFTWTQDNLRDSSVEFPGGSVSANDSTNWSNSLRTWWDTRRNSFESYAGKMILMRWRLKVEGSKNQVDNQNISDTDGLFITDIKVWDLNPNTPAPHIVVNPAIRVFVNKGETTTLSVVAAGLAPLRYEWFLGTPPNLPGTPGITPTNNISVGDNSPSYTPPLTGANNVNGVGTYTYWVRVSNSISDNDASTDPAVSVPTHFTVRNCSPIAPGDCNTYRINMGGVDIIASDSTSPAWAGTQSGSSGTAFYPIESVGRNEDTRIFVTASTDRYINAANIGPGPELMYETYLQRSGDMTWVFPVDPGEYVIRLHMADPGDNDRSQARFDALANNQQLNYWSYELDTSGNPITVPHVNTSVWDVLDVGLGTDRRRAAMIFEYEPISVTSDQNEIRLLLNRKDYTLYVSGIEIFPVTAVEPAIAEQPDSATVITGNNYDLKLTATGANLVVKWYQGNVGDTSTLLTTDTAPTDKLSYISTYPLTNVTAETTYWAEVTGGPIASQTTLNSQAANISVCTDTSGAIGACGRWTINAAGDIDVTAPDGTVWFAEDISPRPSWAASTTDQETGDENAINLDDSSLPYYPGNVDINHVAKEIFIDRRSRSGDWTWEIGPLDPGVYDVTLYFADNDNSTSRKMDIIIEGVEVATNYNMRNDVGVNNTVHSRTWQVTVADNAIDILIDCQNSTVQVSGVEVIKK